MTVIAATWTGVGAISGPVTGHGGSGIPAAPLPPPATKSTRFHCTVRLAPERYGRDTSYLRQKVIQHPAAPESVDREASCGIKAVRKDCVADITAWIVSENARTLKFGQFGFEDR